MPEELIVRHCAPTLAGIKSGSLFSCPYRTRDAFLGEIRDFNRRYASRGLCMLPLRYWKDKALVYLFRPQALACDLRKKDAAKLLAEAGYESLEPAACITLLRKKLARDAGFPHEIGLFLSYPPEDVRGFIENHAENFKCVGVWKVYGDAEKAQKIFEKYKNCTDFYSRCIHSGIGISALAVNTGKG